MKKSIFAYAFAIAAMTFAVSCTKGEIVTEAVDENATSMEVSVKASIDAATGEGMKKTFSARNQLRIRFYTSSDTKTGRTQVLKNTTGDGSSATFAATVAVPNDAAKFVVFAEDREINAVNYGSLPTCDHLNAQAGTLNDAFSHQVLSGSGDVSALGGADVNLTYKTGIVKVVATFPEDAVLSEDNMPKITLNCKQYNDIVLVSDTPDAASTKGDITVTACEIDAAAHKATAYIAVWPTDGVYAEASLLATIGSTTYGNDLAVTDIKAGKITEIAQDVETKVFDLYVPDDEKKIEGVKGEVVEKDDWILFEAGVITITENTTGKVRKGSIVFNNGTTYNVTQIGPNEFKGAYTFTTKLFAANNPGWFGSRGFSSGSQNKAVFDVEFGAPLLGETLVDQDGSTYTNQIGIKGFHGDAICDATIVIDYENRKVKLGLLLDARNNAQLSSESNKEDYPYVCFLPEMGTQPASGNWTSPWNFIQVDLDDDPAKDFVYVWFEGNEDMTSFTWNTFTEHQSMTRSKATSANAIIGITCAVSKSANVDAANVLGANSNANYNVIFQGNVNNSNTEHSFGFARK